MRGARGLVAVGLVAAATGSTPAAAQDLAAAADLVERVQQILFGPDSTKRAAEALALLEKSRSAFPDDQMYIWHSLAANAHAELGDATSCHAALVAGAAVDPDGAWGATRSGAVITLAERRMDADDLRGALSVLVDLEPHVTEKYRFVWYARQGECSERLNRFSEALAAFNKAIELKPDSWCRHYRAKFHHLFGRWDEAKADLDADRRLVEEEKQTGRKHPLRVVVEGPHRERWPNAWPKLELRSRYGHFHVVSQAGVSDAEMNAIEAECQKLDPGRPADARRRASLLSPAKQLVTSATLMELMRSEYMKMINMKEKDWPEGRVFKVFYFETQADFAAFNAAQGDPDSESMLGYYAPMWSFLCLYNAVGGDQVYGMTEETMDTFFHEGWHQFYDVIADRPPIWLNEGLAELLGPTKVLEGGRKLNLAPLVKRRDPERVSRYEHIQMAVRGGTHFPFRTFFRTTPKEWHAGDKSLYYAQSWAVCYYAMRGTNAAFRKDFLAFFWGTTQGRPQKDLVDEFFPDAKLDAYEKAWLDYMKKL